MTRDDSASPVARAGSQCSPIKTKALRAQDDLARATVSEQAWQEKYRKKLAIVEKNTPRLRALLLLNMHFAQKEQH